MRSALTILLVIFCSLSIKSQTVYTRSKMLKLIKWDNQLEEYDRDSIPTPFKTLNPKVIINFEQIQIIDGDTTTIYLNETPNENVDSNSICKTWDDATSSKGRECNAWLFYYPEENLYFMRILFNDDDTGMEYFLKPLKEDVIPTEKSFKITTK